MTRRKENPALQKGWKCLSRLTPARIALGRSGSGLPTAEVLKIAMAHAQARDAVHTPFDGEALAAKLAGLGLAAVCVATPATRRDVYLRRPDLGRRLDEASARTVRNLGQTGADLSIVIADGLSSTAIETNVVPLLEALLPQLRQMGLSLAPVAVAGGGRVALGDEIGGALEARLVLVLIGERPGLSSPDSLGAYLTFEPRIGRNDAERNCVSNIRPGGLGYSVAAFKLAWLIEAALMRRLTGVSLKDESARDLAAEIRRKLPPS